MSDSIDAKFIGDESIAAKVEIDSASLDRLEDKIHELLKNDVSSLTLIRKLLKTESTFKHSLASIYDFLMDQKICRTTPCNSRCFCCPKKYQGYVISPVYSKSRDEIIGELQLCPIQMEKVHSINNLLVCDCDSDDLYYQEETIKDMYRKNSSAMKDTKNFVNYVAQTIINMRQNRNQLFQGLIIHSINQKDYANDLLRMGAYIFAHSGYKVAYINCENLFKSLNDFDVSIRSTAERDFHKVIASDALFIENINLYPSFFNAEFNLKYIYSLLQSRNKQGKVTFASSSTSITNLALSKKILKNCDCIDEGSKLITKLFVVKSIRDFDLR